MAAKLEQVPVPDMSDGIWAGIENQLDAGVRVGTPKGRGWWYGFIGLVAVVTLILLWRHYTHKSNPPERTAPTKSVPMIKESLPARDSSTIVNKPKRKQPPVEPFVVKRDTLLHDNNSVDSGLIEYTPLVRRNISPVRDDSASGHNNMARLPHMDTVTIQPAGKKHRGVRGITDEDYKISAKKDSVGRKD